ncbi:MAG: ribosome-associated translation inhibitor RaiA [Ignavibacteriae bacterium]|jgi:ribosomal subunit interface protein|nr:ribosome-associated translation inhibitor RaiA [Ignavibacteriota bacterium]NOG96574.1 ribosome-associated translation inhibitor RaiA [Ignavibacteriota bacterium]
MNINITSRKFKAKDSLKDHINAEVNALTKFNDDIMEANVVLSFINPKDSIKEAEIILQLPGKLLSVSESTDDFYKSVSGAATKLERKLKKVKSKKLAKVR